MYDPKFSIKQMYDQYGSSRSSSSSTTTTAGPRGYTRKSTPAPTPQQRTDRRYVPTNIAAPKSTSRTDRTAPPRAVDYSKGLGSRAFKPETEELSTWEKVKSAFTNTMETFGIFDEPDTTTTPDAVYKDGNLFSPEPYIPDTSRFEGDTQLKDMTPAILKDYGSIYKREGDISPTLPTGTDNPILNVFGVERGFTRSPAGLMAPPSVEVPANMDPLTRGLSQAILPVPDEPIAPYTIKAGDTLSEIAEMTGTTVKELAEINNIEKVDEIDAGAVINIPIRRKPSSLGTKPTDTEFMDAETKDMVDMLTPASMVAPPTLGLNLSKYISKAIEKITDYFNIDELANINYPEEDFNDPTEIPTVPKYAEKALDKIIENEGGYQNDKDDTGNVVKEDGTVIGTNFGITPKAYANYYGKDVNDVTEQEMKFLTEGQARRIYRQEYYIKPKLNLLPPNLRENVFDMYVNAGPSAIKILQEKAGLPKEQQDGFIGPITIAAIENSNISNNDYVDARIDFYEMLAKLNPKKKKYLRGWKNRANKYRDTTSLRPPIRPKGLGAK